MTWTARRMAGEPLEHIVGWASFAGLRIAVDPGVFVPRRRSELLGRWRAVSRRDVVVDLCCGTRRARRGSGRARGRTQRCTPPTCDPAAVACARRNLPPERVFDGDLYARRCPTTCAGGSTCSWSTRPTSRTDAIATMPREARDHEHRVALDGGADGLDVQRGSWPARTAWLRPGGRLLVETVALRPSGRRAARARRALPVGRDRRRHRAAPWCSPWRLESRHARAVSRPTRSTPPSANHQPLGRFSSGAGGIGGYRDDAGVGHAHGGHDARLPGGSGARVWQNRRAESAAPVPLIRARDSPPRRTPVSPRGARRLTHTQRFEETPQPWPSRSV